VNPAPFFDLSRIMDDLDFLSRPMANFFTRNAASDGITATNADTRFAGNHDLVEWDEAYLYTLVQALFHGQNMAAENLTIDDILQVNDCDGTITLFLFGGIYLLIPYGMCEEEALYNHRRRHGFYDAQPFSIELFSMPDYRALERIPVVHEFRVSNGRLVVFTNHPLIYTDRYGRFNFGDSIPDWLMREQVRYIERLRREQYQQLQRMHGFPGLNAQLYQAQRSQMLVLHNRMLAELNGTHNSMRGRLFVFNEKQYLQRLQLRHLHQIHQMQNRHRTEFEAQAGQIVAPLEQRQREQLHFLSEKQEVQFHNLFYRGISQAGGAWNYIIFLEGFMYYFGDAAVDMWGSITDPIGAIQEAIETVDAVVELIEAVIEGNLSADELIELVGDAAFENIIWLVNHYYQFGDITGLRPAQARELGRRTAGAVSEAGAVVGVTVGLYKVGAFTLKYLSGKIMAAVAAKPGGALYFGNMWSVHPGGAPVTGWSMHPRGATINGRRFTAHALERMAPDTIPVRTELHRRASLRAVRDGYTPGTLEYRRVIARDVNPRNIPPSVVEDVIRNSIGTPGETPNTFDHLLGNARVTVNIAGDVVTVYRIGN